MALREVKEDDKSEWIVRNSVTWYGTSFTSIKRKEFSQPADWYSLLFFRREICSRVAVSDKLQSRERREIELISRRRCLTGGRINR